jgi:hypothetical protein
MNIRRPAFALGLAVLACADAMAAPHERIVCSIIAALDYQIPANIVLAVAEIENGKPGRASKNANGTLDVGPMQFNTVYLNELHGKYGITEQDVSDRGCYPYQLAAWRLRGHIVHDAWGDIWTRAANYHSYTPRFNSVYRARLIGAAGKWANWLSARFKTRDVLKREQD